MVQLQSNAPRLETQNSDIEKSSGFSDDVQELNTMLYILEDIFGNNKWEWFEELDQEDVFDGELTWIDDVDKSLLKAYKGMPIADIMEQFRIKYNAVSSWGIISDEQNYPAFSKISAQYLKMQVWMGDKYEWWASLFKKSDQEIDMIIWNILFWYSSPEKMLDYLESVHAQLDSNNWQSTTLGATYLRFAHSLATQIFEMFQTFEQHDGITDKHYLSLAQILTWKKENIRTAWWRSGIYGGSRRQVEITTTNDIDDNLRNPGLANKIMLYAMYREWWLISKLEKSDNFKIEDEDIWDRDLWTVYDTTIESLKMRFPSSNGKQNNWEELVFNEFGINRENSHGLKYDDVSIQHKITFTFLNKLNDKIESKFGHHFAQITGVGIDTGLELTELIDELAIESQNQVNDAFEDNFDTFLWKDGNDFGIGRDTPEGILHNDMIDFFNEVNGSGIFDLSDTGWDLVKWWSKFAAVIGLSMLTWWIIGWALIAQWIAAWVLVSWTATTVAVTAITKWIAMWAMSTTWSNSITQQWFDTKQEMKKRLGSDFGLWASTWWIWGWIVALVWKEGARVFSKEFLRNWKVIMAGDLVLLSAWPELWREGIMNEEFVTNEYVMKKKTEEEETAANII